MIPLFQHCSINIGLQMPKAANRTTDYTDSTDGKWRNAMLCLFYP